MQDLFVFFTIILFSVSSVSSLTTALNNINSSFKTLFPNSWLILSFSRLAFILVSLLMLFLFLPTSPLSFSFLSLTVSSRLARISLPHRQDVPYFDQIWRVYLSSVTWISTNIYWLKVNKTISLVDFEFHGTKMVLFAFELRFCVWHVLAFYGCYYNKGFPNASDGKDSACNVGDLGSIPETGGPPGEGNGYPLQYSGLENPMDCIANGVAKSQTQLSDFHFSL